NPRRGRFAFELHGKPAKAVFGFGIATQPRAGRFWLDAVANNQPTTRSQLLTRVLKGEPDYVSVVAGVGVNLVNDGGEKDSVRTSRGERRLDDVPFHDGHIVARVRLIFGLLQQCAGQIDSNEAGGGKPARQVDQETAGATTLVHDLP